MADRCAVRLEVVTAARRPLSSMAVLGKCPKRVAMPKAGRSPAATTAFHASVAYDEVLTIVGAAGLMAETTWRRAPRLGAIDARALGGGERGVRSVDTNEDGRRGHWCTSATLASA